MGNTDSMDIHVMIDSLWATRIDSAKYMRLVLEGTKELPGLWGQFSDGFSAWFIRIQFTAHNAGMLLAFFVSVISITLLVSAVVLAAVLVKKATDNWK